MDQRTTFLASETVWPPVSMKELTSALLGESVEMIHYGTINVDTSANAEIVLETELLPDGLVTDEGCYGEFHEALDDVKRNNCKVKAITHRKTHIYYFLVIGDYRLH
jgi:2,5-furandicarboxylate decarboxylase 1